MQGQLKEEKANQAETIKNADAIIAKKIAQKEADVIVCDVNMPMKNGFELLMTIRKNNNNVPFIVFTITEDKETVIKAFSLGASGFVGKYGDPEIVFSTLQRCIEKSVKCV